MTDETPAPFDEGVVEKTAVDEGIEAIRRIHYIERQMLNRAIHSLAMITEKTAEEVLEILSDGIDTDYDAAVKQAQASAKVAQLYVPNSKPTWQ